MKKNLNYIIILIIIVIFALFIYFSKNLLYPERKKTSSPQKEEKAITKASSIDKINSLALDSVSVSLLSRLKENSVLMIGNNTYGHFVFFKPLMDLLNLWFEDAKNGSKITKIGLVLEKRPDQISLIKDYFRTGNADVLLGNNKTIIPAIISTEEMAFIEFLYFLKKDIDEFNRKEKTEICFEIFGEEKEIDPSTSIDDLRKFAETERDEFLIEKLKHIFEENSDFKWIIFYGNSHLFKKNKIPKKGRNTYLGYYIKDYFKDKGNAFIVGASQSSDIFPERKDSYYVDSQKIIDLLSIKEKKTYAFLFLFDAIIKYPKVNTQPGWISASFTTKVFNWMLKKPHKYYQANDLLISMQKRNLISFFVMMDYNPKTEADYDNAIKEITRLEAIISEDSAEMEKRKKNWMRLLQDMDLFSVWKDGTYFRILTEGIKITRGANQSFLNNTLAYGMGEINPVIKHDDSGTYQKRILSYFSSRSQQLIISGYLKFMLLGNKTEQEKARKVMEEITKKNFIPSYNYMIWYYGHFGIM
ncbi:MAG: hypothetical protein JXA60_13615 [Candidatus Coatesbacteria bacterium]|nr:hypothetical protein [Candidatus Coatesbacteria bacterium]